MVGKDRLFRPEPSVTADPCEPLQQSRHHNDLTSSEDDTEEAPDGLTVLEFLLWYGSSTGLRGGAYYGRRVQSKWELEV